MYNLSLIEELEETILNDRVDELKKRLNSVDKRMLPDLLNDGFDLNYVDIRNHFAHLIPDLEEIKKLHFKGQSNKEIFKEFSNLEEIILSYKNESSPSSEESQAYKKALDRQAEILNSCSPTLAKAISTAPLIAEGTALHFCLTMKPVNEEIFQMLIELRDDKGNPIINYNHRESRFGATVVDHMLMRLESTELTKRLLNSLIKLTDNHGERWIDFSVLNLGSSILETLLSRRHRDVELLKMLFDIRNKAGESVLDINGFVEGRTILDQTYLDSSSPDDDPMVAFIRERGGKTAGELRLNWVNSLSSQHCLFSPSPTPSLSPSPAPRPFG